jgi:hypothetical protein
MKNTEYYNYIVCEIGSGVYGYYDTLKEARARARELQANGYHGTDGITWKVENPKVYRLDRFGCKVYRNLYHG